MGGEDRLRRLTVPDGTLYRWRVRHRHGDDEPCEEVLALNRDGVRVQIVFRGGPGRVAGSAPYSHSGLVCDEHGRWVNLHEPGVVRAFVDELRRRGTEAGQVDGWELLPAVVVSRAAAATPGVPPDCPPGP
ncbi:hypothetical protein ABZ865_01660 [Streptomyces sp. NPDC047085]|uniref:hypothetical protein n=1 Tax=Streptomyces sp. NPDC047085 TaxID=3155140 RepID=UPI0033C5552F